jgi:hypothetical protein
MGKAIRTYGKDKNMKILFETPEGKKVYGKT